MDYSKYPVAKRTRSNLLARHLEGIRKKAKRAGDGVGAGGGAGDLELKLNGGTRANGLSGVGAGVERILKLRKGGKGGNNNVFGVKKDIRKNSEKGRKLGRRSNRGDDESEDEEVKFVCELVPESNGSHLKLKGDDFDGEYVINSKNLDILKLVEELGSLSRVKKGRFSNVGKERVGALKRKVDVSDNHAVDLDDLEELELTTSEEDKGKAGGRKGGGKNKVGDLKRKAKVSDYQSVDSDDSEEFYSSSGEEDKGLRGVKSSNEGKQRVGDLKEKVKVSDTKCVDSEKFNSSSSEEDKGKRGMKKGVKSINVGKEKVGDLKQKVKVSDNQYVDSDDSEEFDSSSSEEVKNRNAGKRYVGPLKRKLEASEDDKGNRDGRKGVRTSNVGKIKLGALKDKVEAGDNLFVDTDDLEKFESGSSEEDSGKKGGGKRVKHINVWKKNVESSKQKLKASDNQSFDSDDLEELESSSSEEDVEESYDAYGPDDSSSCDTDSADDSSRYTEEEENVDEEIKEEKDDADAIADDGEEEGENECRTEKENSVGGRKGNKNSTESGFERVKFSGKGKGKGEVVEARLMEKLKHYSQKEEYFCWDDTSKDGNDSIIRNNGNNGKKEEEEKGKTNAVRVSGLKKRRFCGLDILVDSNKDNVEKPQGVASRLRSRSVSKFGKEKLNAGKASHPLPLDRDIYSSSGTDGDNDGSVVRKDGGKRKGKLGKPTGRKNLRSGKDFDPLKILSDSIWNEGESLLEKFPASEEKAQPKEKLVYKFSLADQDPKPPEKSEWEKEVDNLFAEMHMCLTAEEIGSSSSVKDDDTECLAEINPVALCNRGFHQLKLDEQIGIICIHCSYVHLEIKHILPSFSKHPCGRPGKYFFGKADGLYSDFQFQDNGAENLYGFEGSIHNKGTVWDLIPGIKSSMYEHQCEGFEFIWKNIAGGICVENLEKPLSSCGSGCIISHAPGTGKTRLSIVFLQSFMKLYPEARPVIIAPRSMLLTWEEEFKKWNVDVPFHNINNLELSGQENEAAVCFLKKVGYNVKSRKATRIIKLLSWKNDTSVLGISYRLFEKLAGGETKRKLRCDPQEERMGKALLQLSSLLVLDEGHTPRNEQSLIWKALFKVETKRRIILSGTPFQNNFTELYNTLCLVNPKFADSFLSGYNGRLKKDHREIRKASRGKWASMTNSIGDSRCKLRELKAMINPFVHVHKGTILQEKLPGLRDALILLRPTDLQKCLFSLLKYKDDTKSYLEFSHLVTLVSVHPSLLPGSWVVKNAEFSAHRAKLKKHKMDPHAGVKTKFVIELARLCEAWDEKVLVFSQYLDPLTIILKQLETTFNWNEGREVLYMDGKLGEKQRQSSIGSLNDPNSKVRVLLASTKACSEGINLVGASRVVLLDVVWNPSVERQAISRAYRLGQRKIVYIYHLIAGMMEVERYERQIEKERLSELVFSSKDMNSCKEKMSSAVAEDEILEAMVQHNDKLGNMFQNVIYQPKESDLVGTYDLVDKF